MSDVHYEETHHYVNDPHGPVLVKFNPVAHAYYVTDPGYINPKTGQLEPKKNVRMGGGTSLTGLMAKGQGLMLWPMYEMKKFLEKFFEETSIKDLIDNPDLTLKDLMAMGVQAHKTKSDLGKNVGTDAHAWVEEWSNELMKFQESKKKDKKFVPPEIPEVEDIAKTLKTAYLRVINTLKPKDLETYKELPKLLAKEIEIQEAIWTEAKMVRQSIVAAKEWLDLHEIFTYGAEGTVYSRELQVCGKYDDDWEVTCSIETCGLCCFNGNKNKVEEYVKNYPGDDAPTFKGRYVVDYKSTNASQEAPKGLYPEYLAQCGTYEVGLTEEHPDREYTGSLLLNGSKHPFIDKKTGQEYPQFNSHFALDTEDHREWARTLAKLKDHVYKGKKEMEDSNAGIKSPKEKAK